MYSSSCRFLVTGSSGLIGSALVPYLSANHFTIGISRRLSSSPLHKIVIEDLLGTSSREIFDKIRPTHIVHCAAVAHQSEPSSLAKKQYIESVNIDLAAKLAKLAIASRVQRFIFISSAGVHGSSSTLDSPISESSPFCPHNFYASTKVRAEKQLVNLFRNSDTSLVILRPSLVYGSPLVGNLKKLVSAVDHYLPLPFASISNSRSLCSLSNLVDAIESVSLHPRASGEAYLVSDRETISSPDLIKLIADSRSRKSLLFPCSDYALSVISRMPIIGRMSLQLTSDLVVDSSKVRSEIGWSQPFTQREALMRLFSADCQNFA